MVERAIEIRLKFHSVEHSHMTQLLLRRLEILVDGGWAGEAAAGLAELEEILSSVEGGSSRYPARILRLRARIAALEGDLAAAERIFRQLVAGAPPRGRAARAFARDCLDLARLLMRRDHPEASRWLHLADRLLRVHVLPYHPDRVLVTRLLDEPERSPEAAAVGR